ncbi:MAG: ferrous iron transport protein B [Planctomycetes bacterium]|nr:ferrous iron transport protein B [Planctomycetota bacterium]
MSPAAGQKVATASRRVALVGRANAGKTSLLMHLTGSLQRPSNFPGTSVECITSETVHGATRLCILDLPGIASLRAISRDEQVAIDCLGFGEGQQHPDLLCAVLDASKLPVELRLLQQLRSLGRPLVVALTKLDVAAAEGMPVDVEQLQRALGLPLIAVNGADGSGVADLKQLLTEAALTPPAPAAAPVLTSAARKPRGSRSRTDRLDALLLHPLLGPLVLAGVLVLMFQLVFTVAEPFIGWVETAQGWVEDGVAAVVPEGMLRSFLVDGMVNGVGSVLVFVPQIALLIAFVSAVEMSGYMARAVFLLDRLLRKFGLSGKSFVPLTSSFACAIPGILGARILENERDRLATILVAPLMSCSARLPVYVVMLAAFFPAAQAGLLLLVLYLLGIVVAAVVAKLLRKTVLKGGTSMLAMELPVYQRPRLRLIAAHTWVAVRSFLRTAGTVILVATVVVWALGYFPRPAAIAASFDAQRAAVVAGPEGDEQRAALDAQQAAAYLEQSWLADIGRAVQPVFAPAGFDWKITVGVLAAFPARELVIPTLGTLYSLGEVEASADEADVRLRDALRQQKRPDGHPSLNSLIALAVMAFFALCSQCVGTLAAIRRETHSWKWPLFTFGYMTTLAWVVAVGIYQVGSWMGFGL